MLDISLTNVLIVTRQCSCTISASADFDWDLLALPVFVDGHLLSFDSLGLGLRPAFAYLDLLDKRGLGIGCASWCGAGLLYFQ